MDHSVLDGILVLLLLSVLAVAAVRRLHLPPILGYLLVGALFGEHAIGWIPGGHEIEFLAELGVVFLLFMIGLEVSIAHLLAMRGVLIGLGGLQVALSTLSTVALAMWIGMNWQSALAVGGALALSSTAIVVKQLQEQLEIHSRHGRNALGILLFQDLAVVPFLVAIPILAGGGDAIGTALMISLAKAVLAFALMFAVGHWALRPILGWVTASYSVELFTLAILLLSLAAAWATHAMGLSLALGAFLAGVMLAETEYRHQIETEIRPFRDVLLGLFFVTVGTQLNLSTLHESWHWTLLLTTGVVIGKGGRRISAEDAYDHIAAITLCNEGTIRDWVRHAKFNVTQGKNWESPGAMGPWLVPFTHPSQLDDIRITTHVNGELRQDDRTSRMLFPIKRQIEYISTFTTLMPGDIIITGTPTGAGARLDPPQFLKPGDIVTVTAEGIGTLTNTIADEQA